MQAAAQSAETRRATGEHIANISTGKWGVRLGNRRTRHDTAFPAFMASAGPHCCPLVSTPTGLDKAEVSGSTAPHSCDPWASRGHCDARCTGSNL